ncbi:MAG: adenosylmethionine decarboxylase, partial [Hyphomicrobiaceae bacterium]|nr:adenosylmethionine decarboxylase [Hyphomicrobiaceae bacterium]
MAYNDTLFQLGMDLTRSSTAQKEDHGEAALDTQRNYEKHKSLKEKLLNNASNERLDFFIERDGVRYAGNHLIIDLFGAKRIDEIEYMEQTLKQCIKIAGATALHLHLHHFTPNGGISGVAVLSESHISVHSWPEAHYAAFDVFMCGKAKPELCIDVLCDAFEAREAVVKTHQRGKNLDLIEWQQAASPQKRKQSY